MNFGFFSLNNKNSKITEVFMIETKNFIKIGVLSLQTKNFGIPLV